MQLTALGRDAVPQRAQSDTGACGALDAVCGARLSRLLRIEAHAVVYDVGEQSVLQERQGDGRTVGLCVPQHIGQARLHRAQDQHRLAAGHGPRATADAQPAPQLQPLRSRLRLGLPTGPAQLVEKSRILLLTGLQDRDELPGLVQVVPCGAHHRAQLVPSHRDGARVEAGDRGTAHQHDACQPLGERVMDVAGQLLPLDERTCLPLGGDQLLAGALQVCHRLPQRPVLPVQDSVGLRHQSGADCSDERSDHRGGMVSSGLVPEREGDGRRQTGDGDDGPGGTQQVQVQEEQREGDPGEVCTDGQQPAPQAGDHEQPHQRAAPPDR